MVAYTEKAHRDMLKAAGGRWDPEAKLWNVPYGTIRGTELEDRTMTDFVKGNIKGKKGP
jgi:hypothetical protein